MRKKIKIKSAGTRVILSLLRETEELDIVQIALRELGKHLVVDGIIGPITCRAIESVEQKALYRTIEAVRKGQRLIPQSVTKEPISQSWVDVAVDELGVKEIRGGGSNPRVEQYHDSVGIAWAKDDVPWCGSFVGFVLLKAGYKIPAKAYRALSWKSWGKSSHRPILGSIAVKSRKGGGHVTIVVGISKDGKYIYCLGGNQNDAVNIKRYRVSAFLDFRVPTSYYETVPPPVMSGKGGVVREA